MYTLLFPFELSSGRAFTDLPFEGKVGDLDVSLDKKDRYYVIAVKGFSDAEMAGEYLCRMFSGLSWLMLKYNYASQAKYKLQKVVHGKDPLASGSDANEVALIGGESPAVIRTGETFRTVTAGRVTALLSRNAPDVFDTLKDGMQFPNAGALVADNKLQLALDIYRAFFSEHSKTAQFVTLVMVLESLAEGKKRPTGVQSLLKQFSSEVDRELSKADPMSDEAASLAALKRELHFRRDDSIRTQIRTLVQQTLIDNPDVQEVTKTAVRVYDDRSKLVHEGTLPQQRLEESLAQAKLIVQQVLCAKFLEVVGQAS